MRIEKIHDLEELKVKGWIRTEEETNTINKINEVVRRSNRLYEIIYGDCMMLALCANKLEERISDIEKIINKKTD